MFFRTRTWLVIGVLGLVAAAVLWRLGEPRLARQPAGTSAANGPVVTALATGDAVPVRSEPVPVAARDSEAAAAAPSAPPVESAPAWRLRNTDRSVEELARDDAVLLLRNAVLDTSVGTELPLPEHLRAGPEPGSYVIQAEGPITEAFRRTLTAAGTEFVSYLPNNAYLVRATAAQAEGLKGRAGIRNVLAFAPYYKLEPGLLTIAVDQLPMAPETRLNLTLLPGTRTEGLEALRAMGVEVLNEFITPFGPGMTVAPPAESLVAIAQLSSVHGIERQRQRQLLNDLARVRLGISGGTNAPGSFTNYLGLTGTNVVVNVNDTGVDDTHPDLEGRVTADSSFTLIDLDGHGTHVAGTIAGSGLMSTNVLSAPGSELPGADFRGMAPAADIFALPIDLVTGPLQSDAYLQQTAATNYYVQRGGTNLLISNNSWGYVGAYEYTASSASFDAAVRDALPEVPGAQPILYVFAAGNEGAGRDDGQGGEFSSVRAPGTAKNVITVGALESPRFITNEVIFPDADGNPVTNQVFLGPTDSDFQVTSFSSRGNVEPGVEGRYGRFKPDVVAPGSFIASARARGWDDPRSFFAARVSRIPNQEVVSGALNYYSLFVPSQAQEFRIRLLPNLRTRGTLPELPMYLRFGDFPTTGDQAGANNLIQVPPDGILQEGDWFYAVGNDTPDLVRYDVQTIITLTNDFGNYFDQLKVLNDGLGEHYRYESGTSMAAPVVSGLLALFQDYFQREGYQPTPALMKALLINGARSLGSLYNFSVRDVLNIQGWGVASITNSLPAAEIGSEEARSSPVQFADMTTTNAVVTGQSRTWRVSLAPQALDQIVKFTLVWTDPPGNPNAGIKLVNDLDLVVRNLDTDEIYGGNDIPFRSDFNTPRSDLASVTNDVVNNVENVILRPPLGTNYSITVTGRRVNVNALSSVPDGIAQDFALAVSLENPALTNALTITLETPDVLATTVTLQSVTNGIPLLRQRVGANPPLSPGGIGHTNQWRFYAFTNLQIYTPDYLGLTNGANVAFITFLPPNLGMPRNLQADIDLYVSRDSALTNLAPAAVNGALRSVRPGGTEFIVLTNASLGDVFYIGVKSEDQQAAEFGLATLSSDQPFDEEDEEGNRIVRGLPRNLPIPDGSPDQPQAGYVFGIVTASFEVQRVVVTNTVAFDSTGDLLLNLSHNEAFSVLSSHPLDPTGLGTVYTGLYDDSNAGGIGSGNLIARPSDGPGSLQDFIGDDAAGPWILSITDNALTQTATNVAMNLFVQRAPLEDDLLDIAIPPGGELIFFVDVPASVTNMTVLVRDLAPPEARMFVAVRRANIPTLSDYDKGAAMAPPGGELNIGTRDVPPLDAGRWFIGFYNTGGVALTARIGVLFDSGFNVDMRRSFGVPEGVPLVDDALQVLPLEVTENGLIADLSVGLRVEHPRVSDLVFHLLSPQGTRLLLAENRGGPDGTAYGATLGDRRIYTTFPSDTNLTVVPIKFGLAPFTNNAALSGTSNRVVMADGFEDAPPNTYFAPENVAPGWLVSTGVVEVFRVPPGGTNVVEGSQYLLFPATAGSGLGTNLVLRVGDSYRLRYVANRTAITGTAQGLEVWINGTRVQSIRRDPGAEGWTAETHDFVAGTRDTLVEFRSPPAESGLGALALDAVVVEEAETTANATYLPEEPLKPLRGEQALGTWRLQVLDTRAGPAGADPGTVDWRIEFVFERPAVEAIELTNGVPYFGTLSLDEIQYFYVQTPLCATVADNIAAGEFATLLLFGDRDGLPVASLTPPVDDYGPYLNVNPGGIAGFSLSTNFPPTAPLVPGQRYFLALRNFQPDLLNNAYGIMVTFDCEDPVLPTVRPLTNGVPVVATLPPGPDLDYYQFTVSSNAIRADFELVPLDGNVDFFIRQGRPGGSPLPSPNNFDYLGDNPDPTATELVQVDRTSFPVGLTPGVWYIAVRNMENRPVSYQIQVTETYTDITILTSGVPLTSTIAPIADPFLGLTGADLQYYAFLVSSNSVRAQFETFGANGDVNLYVRRGLPIPTPFDFHFAGFQPGLTDEFISVTNTTTPVWLSPGWWFLSVENADITNVTYTIQATEFPATIIPLTNNIPYTNIVAVGETPDYYSFRVSPEALSATFDVYDMSDDVQLLLRRALPVPTFNDYDYALTNAGTAPESIELTPFSFPIGLIPGDWYLSVVNASTNPATYTVRASEVVATVIPLTNGVPYNNSLTPGTGLQYYQFLVSSNATAAEFLLTSAGAGNLDLFVRRGPPLPGAGNAHYSGTNLGVVDERIQLDTNSLPVPLGPGLWYLSVTNNEIFPVTYEITATEFVVEPPPVSGEITDIVVTDTNICITWISIPGTNYYVVAKANLGETTWTPVSPTITAVTNLTTYCVAPPGVWRFFDVFEGDSPVVPIPNPEPVLTLEDDNICVTWNSVPGTTYFVEAKRGLNDAVWDAVTPSVVATSDTTRQCYPLAWGYRIFRVGIGSRTPSDPVVLPPEEVDVTFSVDQICLSWLTRSGVLYLVEGRRTLTDPNWTVITEPLRGDGSVLQLCLAGDTEFRYFRVIEGVTVPPGTPPSVGVPNVRLSVDAAFQLCLTWDTLLGAEYFVEAKERLADLVWTVISPILPAPGLELSFCQPIGSPWRYLQVRRVNTGPDPAPIIESAEFDGTAFIIRWTGPASARYQVFYSDGLMGPWLPAGGPQTSVTGQFEFADDGTTTGGFNAFRFYRLERLP